MEAIISKPTELPRKAILNTTLLIGKEAKLKNLNEVGLKGLSDRITNKIKNSIMKLKYLLAACTAFFLYLAVMMMNCPNRHSTVILWG